MLACAALHTTSALAAPVADGGLIRTPDGAVYRVVGGAPLWISSCAYSNKCAGVVDVKDLSGYKQFPVDNAVVRNVTDGGYYRFAGGAPLLVRCDIGAGCMNPTTIDTKTFSQLGRPNATVAVHLRSVPANSTTVRNADDGRIYRFAGGAPLPIAACSCTPILIDGRTFALAGTATPSLPHLAALPADATFLLAAPTYYRVAGGAAVRLTNCAAIGGCAGPVAVDPATISGLGGGRLLAVPKDGTVLRGLPSNHLWEIDGGYRRQTFVNVAGISVDDGAIAAIPTPPVPQAPPPPPPAPAPAPFVPTISNSYRVTGSRTRFTALTVRGLPAGSKVKISCKGHGCPFRSHIYVPKASALKTPASIKRARFHSRAVLTVTAIAPTGAVKIVNFRMRTRKAPVRTIRCAAPGAALTRC